MKEEQTIPARGKFIVLEGIDGAGTTTQSFLLQQQLVEKNFPAIVTSEPTQGPMGLLLRLVLSNRLIFSAPTQELEILSNNSIALLFAADRLDHLQHGIIPNLEKGTHVICDRYYLSSYAYQMGEDPSNLGWLQTINSKCVQPDLTIYLETELQVAEKRRRRNRWYQELYEKQDVLATVARNYEYAINQVQKDGLAIVKINGNSPKEEVFKQLLATVQAHFPELS